MRDELRDIGNDIASLWGGSCYDYNIDWEKKEVDFYCIENGEDFVTTSSFEEIKEDYDFDVEDELDRDTLE